MNSTRPAQRAPAEAPFAAPSLGTFKAILKRAVEVGYIEWTERFKKKCSLRGYDTLDVVNALRRGKIIASPTYDLARNSWLMKVSDLAEDRTFVVEVALACEDDYEAAPRVSLVTAFFRRRSRLKEVTDWS